MLYYKDTIFAPITSIENSSIAIIRISGIDSFKIIKKFIKKKIIWNNGFFVRKIYDKTKIIDQVLLLVFKNPFSYTGENMVEISFHANKIIANNLILLLLKNNCRLADNGEFTKRAFLNNKINIMQAEAINSLIKTKSEIIINSALSNINNNQYIQLEKIKKEIISIIGNVEVNIDYPEYNDIKSITKKNIILRIKKIIKLLKLFVNNTVFANKYNNTFNIVIIGKPNSGKSTLFNQLLKNDRAIISNIKGTTRDYLKENFMVNKRNYTLIDTAGIQNTKSKIESIGIKKTYECIKNANLIIYLYDGKKENKILKHNFEIKNNTKIINVFNKEDLITKTKKNDKLTWISAKNNKINNLEKIIFKKPKDINYKYVLINEFYILKIKEIIELLTFFINEINSKIPIDTCIIFLYKACKIINIILGIDLENEIIEEIFKKFCLGK